MRDLLLTLFVFGSLPFIIRKPFFGILMFAWLGYMNPHRFTWSFAYYMPFADAVAAATIMGLLFTKERQGFQFNALICVWLAWFLWMNVTTLFAIDFDLAVVEWSRAIKVQVFSLITLLLVRTRKQLNMLVIVIAFSVGFFGIKGGFFVLMTSGEYLVWGPPGSFFEGNNGLACALLMVLPLFWYLRSISSRAWLRYALTACMFLCAASILSSYSRGAFIGIAAVAVYLVWKSRARLILGVAVVVVGSILLAFMPTKWHERIESIQDYQQDNSALGRINAWKFAYNVASDHPVVGGGFGVFNRQMFLRYAPEPERYHDAHSIYFEVLGEHGFVGLTIFLVLGILALAQGTRIRRMTRGKPEMSWAYDLASMVQVSLVGYAVTGLFLGLAYFDLYYSLLVIMLMTYRITVLNERANLAAIDDEHTGAGRERRTVSLA